MNGMKDEKRSATLVSSVSAYTAIGAVMLALIAAPAAAGECIDETPLPESLKISPPADGVPADVAAFSGIWGDAKWDGSLCHTLVVKSIDANGDAEVVYSYGSFVPWGIHNPEYFEPSGTIEDGTLTLERFRNGAKVSYTLDGDKLKGRYVINGNVSRVKLSRIPE